MGAWLLALAKSIYYYCEIWPSHSEPTVAGVKVARLPSIRWKDIAHEYFADRVILAACRCVEQHHFVCKLPVGVVFSHQFRSQF